MLFLSLGRQGNGDTEKVVSELNFVSWVCILNHYSHLEHQLEHNKLPLEVNYKYYYYSVAFLHSKVFCLLKVSSEILTEIE